jgi:branched-chain amino acid transport system substrate-binding protein
MRNTRRFDRVILGLGFYRGEHKSFRGSVEKGVIMFLIPLFLFLACTSTIVRDGGDLSKSLSLQRFREARDLFRAGDIDRALGLFEAYVEDFPEAPRTDQALLYLGRIYTQKEEYQKASSAYKRLTSGFPTSLYRQEASYGLALSYSRLKRHNDSIQLLKDLLSSFLQREERIKAYTLSAYNYLAMGEFDKAISMYIKAYKWARGDEKDRVIQEMTQSLSHLPEGDLLIIQRQYEGSFLGSHIQTALTNLYARRDKSEGMEEGVEEVIVPEESEDIPPTLEEGEVATLGCILPLSGDFKPYGEQVLRGVKLAEKLARENSQSLSLRLLVKDSKGDSYRGEQAVEDLAREGAMAILGFLGRPESVATAKRAQELGIPIITLTQEHGITEIGDFVFRDFLRPEAQIETLVDYAMESLGLMGFAVLYPDNSYGNMYKDLFVSIVEGNGGIVVGIESYTEGLNDFREIIQRLDTTFFEAVFIPDSFEKIALIAPQFTYCDITDTRFLGTNLWNTQRLVDIANEHLQGAIFVDGFFRSDSSSVVQQFVENFYLTFWEQPHFLEAQGYDVMRILLHTLQNNTINSREELRDKLFEIEAFPGVTGTTTFTETGDAEKQLFILSIRGKRIVEVK